MNVHRFVDHYFGAHTTGEVKELYLASGILGLAASLVAIFEPIYLYKIGFTLPQIFLFLAALYIGYFIFLPFGGKIALRIGFEHAMLLSSPFLILYYFVLNTLPNHPTLIIAAVGLLICQKILYWPAFHAELTLFGTKGERGRELSGFIIIQRLATVLGPAIGGILFARSDASFVFLLVGILILASNIPLLITREVHAPIRMGYAEAWRAFWSARLRRPGIAFAGFGEETIWYIGWFIFIFITVRSFEPIGFLVSGSMLLGTIAAVFIGRLTDHRMKQYGVNGAAPLVRFGALIVFVVWIFRLLLPRGVIIFLIETLDRIAFPAIGTPLRAMTYELARTDSVMPTIVALEMYIAVGKTVAAFLGVMVTLWFDPPWVPLFLIGIPFTLLYMIFSIRGGKQIPVSPGQAIRTP